MRLLKILLALLAGISLTSCKGMPVEPEIRVCEYLLQMNGSEIDYQKSIVKCVSDFDPNDTSKQITFTLPEFLIKKPISTSVEDYSAKLSWGIKLNEWGKTHCSVKGAQ